MARSLLISDFVDVDGLAEVLAHGQAALGEFVAFPDGQETVNLSCKRLGVLDGVENVIDVVVEGGAGTAAPWATLRQALERGAEPLGGIGMLTCYVGFEEASSSQQRNCCDLASVGVTRGRPFFGYSASASRVNTDRAYRRDFMRRLASSGLLPIEFVDQDPHFTLLASGGSSLELTNAELGGKNPRGFRCSEPGPTGGAMVELLESFVTRFGSGKLFNPHWKVNASRRGQQEAEKAESAELLARVRALALPAKSFALTVTVKIDSPSKIFNLTALAAIKPLRTIPIATFESGRKRLELAALVTADGVRLRVAGAGSLDAAGLSEALGTTLRRG